MGADEQGTLATLKAHREAVMPIIRAHGGRVVGTAGDGLLLEFPSVTEAVLCAVEVQPLMDERNASIPEERKMLYRVGINLGDVMIDGDDIYGDGVNIAARLEALAEPGGVCVSQTVLEHVRDRIDVPFDDLGEVEVKNIVRPVRVWRWAPMQAAAPDADLVTDPVAEPGGEAEALALPDKPSIAVLPFENMSGDPEQEFFADGMTEDIITALSRYRSLFVIARNSTFAYKGQSPDLRDVARDLGVKYVLEGSIRKGGNRIRVTGQLIEGASGSHIWAERYDRDLTDIFALQDEITETIVAAIGPEIDQVERERARLLPPDDLDTWESYQRGLWHLYRFSREDNTEAQRLFRQASARSPNFSPALSGLTHARYYAFMHSYVEDKDALLEVAFESGRAAIAADDRDADAHYALCRILYLRHDYDAAVAEGKAAVAYNPNMAQAYLGLATALLYAGDRDRAIESADRALRLSPHDPLIWILHVVRAFAFMIDGEAEKAEECARQAVRQPTAEITAYFSLASAIGWQGKAAEAAKAMTEVLRRKPDFNSEYVAQVLPFKNPADLEFVVEGLHKAGLPR